MKKIALAFICSMILISVSGQKKKTKDVQTKSGTITLPLNAESWDFEPGKVSFIQYKGIPSIRMDENSGVMLFKGLNFSNGIIEFDVEVNQPQPFPSLYFRWKDQTETEHVYLRTGASQRPAAFDAVQYASIINGVNLWDLQHEYQSSAPIKINDWNHVKMVISGKQMKVYVNNTDKPVLEIPALEGNTSEGRIGIGTGFPGQSVFANITVQPGVTENLSPLPGADLTAHDTRYIRHWQISATDSLPYGREVNAYMIPKERTGWESIEAERRALVNLSRKYPQARYRQFIWLRATIKADYNQIHPLKLGFSDEVWVFINQQPVYVDKNIYFQNMRKSPNGRISIDNASFNIPLVKGDNEILIGLTNDFYGWGIMARLEHLEGIVVEGQ